MNAEHTTYLVEHYPHLYKDYGGSMRQTCMHWGFECGDGWFGLLKELSEKLEPLGTVASQVKEKFGTLRFYTTGDLVEVADEVDAAIRIAEDKSAITCEDCGEPAEINDGPWFFVRCEKCVDAPPDVA